MQLENSQAGVTVTSEQFCFSLAQLQNAKLLQLGYLQVLVWKHIHVLKLCLDYSFSAFTVKALPAIFFFISSWELFYGCAQC